MVVVEIVKVGWIQVCFETGVDGIWLIKCMGTWGVKSRLISSSDGQMEPFTEMETGEESKGWLCASHTGHLSGDTEDLLT